jgi:hypothetical protein
VNEHGGTGRSLGDLADQMATAIDRALGIAAAAPDDPEEQVRATEAALSRLRELLVEILGAEGYHALLARALYLAQRAHPLLDQLRLVRDAEGSGLSGLDTLARNGGARPLYRGLVAVLAYLMALLVTFLGEDLAIRLVREAWPEIGQAGEGKHSGESTP